MLLAGGYLYHPPVAVISPGTSVDVTGDIDISGVSVDDVSGDYVLTAVSVAPAERSEGRVGLGEPRRKRSCPFRRSYRRGSTRRSSSGETASVFRQSEQIAAAAAARAAGEK